MEDTCHPEGVEKEEEKRDIGARRHQPQKR
jgi:hypothetical protein